jgi:hypothetical protein
MKVLFDYRLLVSLLTAALFVSCGSTNVTPNDVALAHYIQSQESQNEEEGHNESGSNSENDSITLLNFTKDVKEFCLKNPRKCGDKFQRIVIGGCSISNCTGQDWDKLTLPPNFLTATYSFEVLDGSSPSKEILVDQNSPKLFLSKTRFEKIDFLITGKTYNIEVEAQMKNGNTFASKIQNLEIVAKK